MSNKKQRNLDKRIQKEMRNQKAKSRQKRMPWLFGGALVAIALIIGGYVMSNSYDNAKQANAEIQNYYKNAITPAALKQKIDNKEDMFAYFYQPSCSHCKVVTPILVPMAEKLGKTLYPVNIERDNKAWEDFKIEGTPTLIHFKDGKEVGKIVGEQPESVFREFLQK
jgi:thioredoxin-like negative regulator of GroEL